MNTKILSWMVKRLESLTKNRLNESKHRIHPASDPEPTKPALMQQISTTSFSYFICFSIKIECANFLMSLSPELSLKEKHKSQMRVT